MEPGPGGRRRDPRRGRRRRFGVAAGIIAVLLTAIAGAVLAIPVTKPAPVTATGPSRPVTPPRAAVPRPAGGDLFAGVRLYSYPGNAAAVAAAAMAGADPVGAATLRKIASQPTAAWFGGWIPAAQVAAAVRDVLRAAAADRSMPLLVLYAFPYRDCAQDPAAAAGYERWIGQVAAAIGTGRAAVILEPDALAQYIRLGCLTPAVQRYRLEVLRQAVGQLARLPDTAVYLDAGNSHWQPASVMAPLLLSAGVREARGFSLNVSNFYSTADEEAYGARISALVGGTHFVIDTSRNGAATARTWCNPPGQALGSPPTADTGDPLVDALLWVKLPGSSDGSCNGGPPAGVFWPSYALGLAANAGW